MTAVPTSTTNLRDAKQLGLPDIAFIGGAGAGKSSAAQWAGQVALYRTLSFAEPLKKMAAELWGTAALKDRETLQRFGMAVRSVHEDTWCELLVRRLERLDDPAVVDDCRFPNEYDALRGAGFKFIRIEAGEVERLDRLHRIGKDTTPEQLEHKSETLLDSFAVDYTIQNDCDRVEFFQRVSNALIAVSR